MSTENPTHEQKPISNYHPKDVSRFTRWVHQMDEKDRLMASPRRKQKWLILMGALSVGSAFSRRPGRAAYYGFNAGNRIGTHSL